MMNEPCLVKLLPEAEECLHQLVDALFSEGHSNRYVYAFIDEIMENLLRLPDKVCQPVPQMLSEQLGLTENLWFAFFKRKTSRRTTWYVVFEKKGEKLLVHHITNNWFEGQYIR